MHEIVREITRHGYIALFASVFARQLCLPVPAILFLLAAGAMAAEGRLNLAVVILLGVTASVIADLIWYQAGRLRGDAVLHFVGRFSFGSESSAVRMHNFFRTHGLRTLLVSKFVIGLDALAPPLAGIFGASLGRFLAFDAVGATLWAVAYAGLGSIFSKQLSRVTTYVQRMGGLLSGLVLVLIVIIVARRRLVVWYRVFQELRFARIMPEELKQAMESGEPPVVLDVEGCAFHHPLHVHSIPGAIQIDGRRIYRYEDIPIPPEWEDRQVVLYCSCPHEITSARVARLLKEKGVAHVRPLAGGLRAWMDLGYPVLLCARGTMAGESVGPIRRDG